MVYIGYDYIYHLRRRFARLLSNCFLAVSEPLADSIFFTTGSLFPTSIATSLTNLGVNIPAVIDLITSVALRPSGLLCRDFVLISLTADVVLKSCADSPILLKKSFTVFSSRPVRFCFSIFFAILFISSAFLNLTSPYMFWIASASPISLEYCLFISLNLSVESVIAPRTALAKSLTHIL